MWHQSIDPFHNLGASAAVAAVPIAVLFALLVSKRVSGHIAAVVTLLSALAVATIAYHMPLHLALLSTGYGILMGLFPIGWIVLSAVFMYHLSVRTGGFKIVCSSIESITADRRLQALLIAFCFGAFLEGCAGFGAPVAITTGMLVGLGFEPLYAAGICLIANSAPVAYGSIGIPIITAAKTSGVDPVLLGKVVAQQLPILSFIVPFWLVILMAGWKGAKEIWPAILVTALSYTLTMYLVATYLGPLLPNILSAVVSIVCLGVFLRFWKPKTLWRFPSERDMVPTTENVTQYSVQVQVAAWTPFVLLVLFVSNWGFPGIKAILDLPTANIPIIGLNDAISSGAKSIHAIYSFNWLSAAGTAILIASVATIALQRIPLKTIALSISDTGGKLRNPLITISSIVGFAYLANYCGMSLAMGSALTATGRAFAFVAPMVGWIGVFVSGSDTASNALFSGMQKAAATHLGLNPLLTIAANTDGGVCGKMISPQSIAVAAGSSSLVGKEGQMFRRTLPHSLGMLAIICILTYLQAHAFSKMIPNMPTIVSAALTSTAPPPIGAYGIGVLVVSALVILGLAVTNARTSAAEVETSG
jgi:lactate permease